MAPVEESRSSLREFLASIATIPGDLSNITAPPFLLHNQSTTEFPSYWAEHPSIFTAPATEPEPAKRALLVLKWFLSSLRSQQYMGRDPSAGVKKPLNAFLGEIFMCKWKGDGVKGETRLISEQVSHHPPVTACYLWNDEVGIRASGYTRQSISLSQSFGSVSVRQTGHAILHIDGAENEINEDYLIPLPDVKVKGVLSGAPYPELIGTYYICGSNGYVSEISFSGKGFWGGGERNTVTATLFSGHDLLYRVHGTWSGELVFEDAEGREVETYDTHAAKGTAMIVDDVEDQDPWESRRAWGGVIDALNHGDMGRVSREKGKVEEGQRRLRREEEKTSPGKGVEDWPRLFFRNDGVGREKEVFERLAAMIPEGEIKLEANQTVGVWRFDEESFRLKSAKRPWRGELKPWDETAGNENGDANGTVPNHQGKRSSWQWGRKSSPASKGSGGKSLEDRMREASVNREQQQGDEVKQKNDDTTQITGENIEKTLRDKSSQKPVR